MSYVLFKDQYKTLPSRLLIRDECGSTAIIIGSYIDEHIERSIYILYYLDGDIRESHSMFGQWQISDDLCDQRQHRSIIESIRCNPDAEELLSAQALHALGVNPDMKMCG